jgi:hypothetical protein
VIFRLKACIVETEERSDDVHARQQPGKHVHASNKYAHDNRGTAGGGSSGRTPSLVNRGGPISKHVPGFGTNKNMVMDPDGTRNQE